jgi:hypothetical protein
VLYREKIAVCSEIHTKHIYTLRGQNVELLSVKPGATYSNQWDLECQVMLGLKVLRSDQDCHVGVMVSSEVVCTKWCPVFASHSVMLADRLSAQTDTFV